MQTVGLALIVKNEEHNIIRLFDSFGPDAFDQIVVVDTGSTDGTVESIHHLIDHGWPIVLYTYAWHHDFAAARNFADSFLTTDWKVWADADDVIIGADQIKSIVNHPTVPDDLCGFICGYDYAQHPQTGACVCFLKRERIVRNGWAKWDGRVHEAQIPLRGKLMFLNEVIWKHQKVVDPTIDAVASARSNDRNLEILEKWVEDEPENPRVLHYLGTENASKGNHETAISFYERYLEVEHGWNEQKAQVYRKMCQSLVVLDTLPEVVEDLAYEAMRTMPKWPDSYLTLAECAIARQEWDSAVHWAHMAASFGVPETLLIINPLDYLYLPLRYEATARAGMGDVEGAIEIGQRAIGIFPDIELYQFMAQWNQHMKVERTAATFAMCAQQLINHDEQMKAYKLITECVPHFAFDHPTIVALRVSLKQRLAWVFNPEGFADHYENGGSKPEDFLSDEMADEVCSRLPRAGFILDGIQEQIASA